MYSECTCQSLDQVRKGHSFLISTGQYQSVKSPIFAIFFIAKLIESAATIDIQEPLCAVSHRGCISKNYALKMFYFLELHSFYPLLNHWRGSSVVLPKKLQIRVKFK